MANSPRLSVGGDAEGHDDCGLQEKASCHKKLGKKIRMNSEDADDSLMRVGVRKAILSDSRTDLSVTPGVKKKLPIRDKPATDYGGKRREGSHCK